MFIRHSAILRTGILLIGLPIAFQLGALAFLLKVQNDTGEAQRWELHSKQVLSRTAELGMTLNQGHAAIRGASIYQTLDFERDRREALGRWPSKLARLRALLADNPGQQAQLDRVGRAAEPYLGYVRQMEQLGRRGDWATYRAELLTARGKSLIDAVQAALDHFAGEEERLDRQRLAQVAATRQRERSVLLVVAVLTVTLAIGLLVTFTRGLSSRVAQVTVNGQRLATGEALITPLSGDDEIAALDRVLHTTSERLAAAAAIERQYASELRARSQALEQANRDLLFKTQENEMFVYSVSHDLRSPLVNVQGFTRELTRSCDELRAAIAGAAIPPPDRARLGRILESDIAEAIVFIQTAVTRLSAIVDALLRLSRAGRVEFARQRVELGPVVDRIARAMRATIDERHATVTAEPLPAVVGDPTALEQVFANLIGNALNYLDPNRPGQVRIGTVADGSGPGPEVTIYVHDNGLGIAAKYLSKLFVPFERLHGNVAKGEGIGLALARRIVDRHGGRIWAESDEGKGATFFVSLPRADEAGGVDLDASRHGAITT